MQKVAKSKIKKSRNQKSKKSDALRWIFDNKYTKTESAGKSKFDKAKSIEKIGGQLHLLWHYIEQFDVELKLLKVYMTIEE